MKPRSIHPNRQRILDVLLREVPMSDVEIARIAFVSHRSVKEYLRDLHAERVIHIHEWRSNSPGSPTRVWVIGNGEDAQKPARLTSAERRRKDRARPGAKEREAEMKRNRRRFDNLAGKSTVAALLGV